MRKGFTLIELLAVIVILAIIALIATPLIINVIDESKKGAFKNSAYGIAKAGELSYTQDILNGTADEVIFTYTDGIESSSVSGKKLNYRGVKPKNGTVIVNAEGKVAIAIHDGTYCAEKGYDESEVTLSSKTVGECTIATNPTVVNADTSGAAIPGLTIGMIPVKWDGTNWIKADANNEAGDNQWYDYDAKMWANAVTVTSANRSTYSNAEPGTTIPIGDINTMWVWIPRYKYAIPDSEDAVEINIVFEDKDVTKSTGDATGTNYLTHPAFTFGTDELNGLWIGKFETTGDISAPTIMPNAVSLRNQTVKNMYDASRTMENNTTYGFSTDGDIHMMKNSEWGAVAYLSHSQYGINGELYKNNSSSYYTGRSGGNIAGSQITVGGNEYIDTGFYTYDGKCATTTTLASGVDAGCTNAGNDLNDKSLAYNASTTGNIYGVYDMSGGSLEVLMSVYRDTIGALLFNDLSEFGIESSDGSLPDEKYWDRYNQVYPGIACNNSVCYGQSLIETYEWYGNLTTFVSYDAAWLRRGGYYDGLSQTSRFFSYTNSNGGADINTSFRIVQLNI